MFLLTLIAGWILQLPTGGSLLRWSADLLVILAGLMLLLQAVRCVRTPVFSHHGVLGGACVVDIVMIGFVLMTATQNPWLVATWGAGLIVTYFRLWDLRLPAIPSPVRGVWAKRAAALVALGLLLTPVVTAFTVPGVSPYPLPFLGDLLALMALNAWEPYLAWRLLSEA